MDHSEDNLNSSSSSNTPTTTTMTTTTTTNNNNNNYIAASNIIITPDPNTPDPADLLPRRIQIISWKTGGQPHMVAVYGLASLNGTYYLVLKRRLGCEATCGSNRFQLRGADPYEVARVLVDCNCPLDRISICRVTNGGAEVERG